MVTVVVIDGDDNQELAAIEADKQRLLDKVGGDLIENLLLVEPTR